jgi:hypothetical protein
MAGHAGALLPRSRSRGLRRGARSAAAASEGLLSDDPHHRVWPAIRDGVRPRKVSLSAKGFRGELVVGPQVARRRAKGTDPTDRADAIGAPPAPRRATRCASPSSRPGTGPGTHPFQVGLAGSGQFKLNHYNNTDFRRLLRATCVSPARRASYHRRVLSSDSSVLFKQTAAHDYRCNACK